ncbi:universal stress protein [Paralcaligenes ureilyticus]|uniref:Nucleotide-binding universal stress UspA family protein n=1 Tax=Paralcaligenes ureilyticus TaxID=627131 RepID=A0A4R3M750_9BURK|nr:universal stress protein [Paralcaligenes ureilyticus]TCT08856.1 nucleotide-binding universal stress UspA family protein [Paralcaligenes ureilyticus]
MLGRIALDLTRDPNQAARIQTAILLAAHHKAKLIGVCTTPQTPRYMYDKDGVPDKIMTPLFKRIEEDKTETQEYFLKEAAAAGIKAQCRMPTGPVDEVLALQARFSDLLIMSQTDNAESAWAIQASVAESVITSAGRPVLMIPYIGTMQHPIGQHVLFCWDYGRRAARALADAAPLLSMASELTILTVDPQPEMLRSRGVEPDDLRTYCAEHGYPAPKEIHKSSKDASIGNSILNAATDYGCDLVVMGIYNRSRVREWLLGGTSKTLLQSMTVPILFSH